MARRIDWGILLCAAALATLLAWQAGNAWERAACRGQGGTLTVAGADHVCRDASGAVQTIILPGRVFPVALYVAAVAILYLAMTHWVRTRRRRTSL